MESRLTWDVAGRPEVQLSAAQAQLPDPLGELDDLQLRCPAATVTATRIACEEGRLVFRSSVLGAQEARAGFDYRPETGRLELSLAGIVVAGGRLSLGATLRDDGRWEARLQGTGIRLVALSTRLAAAGLLPAPLEGSGELALALSLEGAGTRPQQGRLTASLQSGEFSDATGDLAGDGLRLEIEGELRAEADAWRIDADLRARAGQVYAAPLYVDLDARPLQASAALQWTPRSRRLAVRSLEVRQPDVVTLQARGMLDLQRTGLIEALDLRIEEGIFPALYETWLQPWLAGTMLADLQTGGGFEARLSWAQGELEAARMALHALALDDNGARFGLEGVSGRLDWGRDARERRSVLHWEGGHLYHIPLGAGAIDAGTSVAADAQPALTRLRLREPARIGVLDGELQLAEFMLEYAGGAVQRWQLDGILTPVSLRRLTTALGWPEFAGRLSGVIPDVRYADGILSVGGILLVRVFDGEITLQNLSLQQPFSVVPRLRVDARVDGLDLKTLTQTFSFGRIEGRLDGRVEDLYLESWRPVRFDAAFATPEQDRSRHRISQRAVDNISRIGGGGVSGALSRSFLRFFEDFPYDRLGLRCRLENGVCEMGGVAPAGSGYYIVKGRLLPPRLDVIGYADRVDWDALVSQLAAVIRQPVAQVE